MPIVRVVPEDSSDVDSSKQGVSEGLWRRVRAIVNYI